MIDEADNDRTAVYSAELTAFDGTDLEVLFDYHLVVGKIEVVASGEWWPGPSIEVRRARADASSSSTGCCVAAGVEGLATIRLAAGQTTIATAAHEMAHVLAGVVSGHGPTFRRAYLDIVGVITNIDSTDRRRDLHVGQLGEAFSEQDLEVASRPWAPPPSCGAIAL